MNGAYIARLDIEAAHLSGVAKKITAQRASLASKGLTTTLYTLRSHSVTANERTLRPAASDRFSQRMTHYHHFWTEIRPHIENAEFLYIRFQGAGPGMLNMLSWFRKRRPDAPVALEIPTYPYRGERRGLREKTLGIVDDLSVPRLKKYIDRIVTFSEQSEIFGIQTLKTQNGVDVAALPVASPPCVSGPIRLIGVANFAFWHGYDRIIEGLAHLPPRRRERVVIDLVGSGAETEALKTLARARGVEDRVHFHGPLTGSPLDAVMSRAHLGIGCLGLHRVYKETSDLKTREYCARGRPFLADRLENDYRAVSKFVWVCPADDTPIDLDGIIAWWDGLEHDRATRILRAHAEAHLSWDAKMVPVVDWLATRLDLS